MPKKPTATEIRAVPPLSAAPRCPRDPITACNVCGLPSVRLALWREHDEFDRPTKKVVFVDASDEAHAACRKALDDHPRLYARERGLPGYFPALCGSCTRRSGWRCTDPRLKANGGPGLRVSLSGLNAIFCGPGGCRSGLTDAVDCEGREVAGG